ncbi:MAG: NAD(+)/NADH kinase [Actinomycetota bacterium]
MKRILVVAHPSKPEAKSALEEIERVAARVGLELSDPADAESSDLVVALGGDGTILRAAVLAHREDIPLLGVNIGRLGFLSSIETSEIRQSLERLASDDFDVEERVMIQTAHSSLGEVAALNEIVVERAAPARVVRVEVTVGGESLSVYTADGVIVATPSGSTAYSLSAGGPVVDPRLRALVVTPVSPHHPLLRSSLVVDPSNQIRLEVVEGEGRMSSDGEMVGPVVAGDAVTVKIHERPLRLVNFGTPPGGGAFFNRLRERFGLGAGRVPGPGG